MSRPPLAGVKVVEITSTVAGPMVGMQLVEMGASVTKVEPLTVSNTVGDRYRLAGSFKSHVDANGRNEIMGSSFYTCNKGKKSIALNLKTNKGRSVLRKLLSRADVLIMNMRPGVAARLGADYKSVSRYNPGIVVCSVTGFGASGPWANKKAYDVLIQATAGAVSAQGRTESQACRYSPINTVIMDKATAMTAVQAILAALLVKEKSRGSGQLIDVAMMDVGFSFLWPDVFCNETFLDKQNYTTRALIPELFGVAQTADRKYVTVTAGLSSIKPFAKMFQKPEILTDRKYASVVAKRNLMIETYGKYTQAEILRLWKRADMPGIGVYDIKEAFMNPQALHNNNTSIVTDPVFGRVRQARPAPILHTTPLVTKAQLAPRFGQHSLQILDELGLPSAEIRRMIKERIVGTVIDNPKMQAKL